MPTSKPFSALVSIATAKPPFQSIGSHLSAKLESFKTDERTLTDELCDMLCIWLSMAAHPRVPTNDQFLLSFQKTTVHQEVVNGADLELRVQTPLGTKRCLLQAKVLDPDTHKLRCASNKGWEDLRVQLVKAREHADDLAFLLVYVPGAMLTSVSYGHGTYEQGFLGPQVGVVESCYGATVIAVSDLIDDNGDWIDDQNKVEQTHFGVLKHGMPFWRFMLEVMLCRRGRWSKEKPTAHDDKYESFRSLDVVASEISERRWYDLQERASYWLDDDGSIFRG